MSEPASRLSRWSQRKAAARRGEALPEPVDAARPAVDEAAQAAEAAVSDSGEAPRGATEGAAGDDMPVLPSIDELDFQSDYSVFLNAKVPEALRRAALRKLWTSDPVLACLDGLNDYDEDYHAVDTTITAAQTAYRAGVGYAEEIEQKLDQVEEALGTPAGAQDESQPGESLAAPETAGTPQQDEVALGESDAAGDNSADAPRRVSAAAPDPASN